jgi:hypothetical protein
LSCLDRVPTENKEITSFKEWVKKILNLPYLCTWGFLAKVNVSINEKHKLGLKTVNCVFLGYAIHSVGYRFLIIKTLECVACMLVLLWSLEMLYFLK